MRHFIIVSIVAIVTLAIVFAIYRPDLLEGVWLWVVGLAAPVIGATKQIIKRIGEYFKALDLKEKITGK